MKKNPIYKSDFHDYKSSKKFAKKQSTKAFLISKDNVCQRIDIFTAIVMICAMKYSSYC